MKPCASNAADAGLIPDMTKQRKKVRILKSVVNGIQGKNVLSSLPVGNGFLFVLFYYYFFFVFAKHRRSLQKHTGSVFLLPLLGL